MLNGYRFRLYPTKTQEQTLLQWIGCQRLIYSAKVQEDRYYRAFQRRFVGAAGESPPIDQEYARFKDKKRTPFLYQVPSQVLRNGAVRWKQAYARFFQHLGGRPKFQTRRGPQSVWLTAELFRLESDPATGGYQLQVGTERFPVGAIPYTTHRPHAVPVSIHITVDGGHWFVAWSAEDATVTMPGHAPDIATEQIANELRHLTAEQLRERTCGGDRGIAKPLMTSDGQVHDLLPIQKQRIQHARKQQKKWQHKAAHRKKGSRNQKKAYRKAGRYGQYEARVQEEYAHQTSHSLVANDGYSLYAFEDLPIANLTKKPKARPDGQGHWLKNGARAKAGLNRAILASGWGRVVQYTEYRALRADKLVVKVPFAYSSQECAACGFTHPDNQLTQADFVCQRCGHTDNADHNAAIVIARRGVRKLGFGFFDN